MSALRKPTPEFELDTDSRQEAHVEGAMSFLEHLDELRTRLIIAVAAIVGGLIVACFFIDRLFAFVMRPIQASLPAGERMIFTEPTEGIAAYMQIAALAGLLIASPVVLWQVWLFIAPGLYAREKRLAIPFVLSATLCFVTGAAFSHFVAFPAAVQFFASFSSEYLEFKPRLAPNLSLYLRMVLGFGLVFQMPTLTMFLARMRMVTAGWLARNFKYGALAIFIIAAIVTPGTDPFSQAMMAVPMLVLYGISIVVAWICAPRRQR